jgi:membrane associated rhomboid family serine protease
MILIPYRDQNRPTRIPIMTPLLVLTNVCLFAYQTYLGWVDPNGTEDFIYRMGAIPWELTHLRDFDGKSGPLGIFFTPVSSLFTHGGVIHIAFNMLYLWIFGDNVEDRMGRIQFLFFYLLCGLGAVVLHVIIQPASTTPLIGASGAIFGVMAAYAILFPGARLKCVLFLCVIPIVIFLPALVVIVYFLAIQILSARVALFDPHQQAIAWFAHIGGFLTGVVYVHRMRRFIRPPRRRSRFE